MKQTEESISKLTFPTYEKNTVTITAFEQYNDWQKDDAAIAQKLRNVIKETMRDPFSGIGKPERLKHDFSGCWSRRITEEHRLVYRVTNEYIEIIACKFHY